MFGGILKKFGTESYGISGTFSALALLCAKSGIAKSAMATARQLTRQRFIDPPGTGRRIYTGLAFKSLPRRPGPSLATLCEAPRGTSALFERIREPELE